jgi:hypothetical protein
MPCCNALAALGQKSNRSKVENGTAGAIEGDCPDAWEQIVGELDEMDNVTLAYRDDGHVQIFWTAVQDD